MYYIQFRLLLSHAILVYNTYMMRHLAFGIFLSLLFIIASLNVFFSQQFPPIMYKIVYNQERAATVQFLRTIRGENFFPQQLAYYQDLYGPSLESAVFQDATDSLSYIKKLEIFLDEKPKSRDVLVKLALFYSKRGEPTRALNYYRRAKLIDPWLDIPSLEKQSL